MDTETKAKIERLTDVVFWRLARCFGFVLVGVFLIQGFLNLIGYGMDSTDGQKRSGMALHVDNATGCEYLSVSGGGIAQRFDANGEHKGCRK